MTSQMAAFLCFLLVSSAHAMMHDDSDPLSPAGASGSSSASAIGTPTAEAITPSNTGKDEWSWETLQNLSNDAVHDKRLALRKSAGIDPFQPTVPQDVLEALHVSVTDLTEYVQFVEEGFPIENLDVSTHANFIADLFDALQFTSGLPGVSSQLMQKILNDRSLEATTPLT